MVDRYSPQERRTYTNTYREERRKFARTALGGKCTSCGAVENLEFDHVDPKSKILPIGKMWTASKEKFLEELFKCQLLCRPCHIIKSQQEGSFHGKHSHSCAVSSMESTSL